MEDVSAGVPERGYFLRATLNMILRPVECFQGLIHLYGPGGTGKTTFTNLASALVGDEKTHYTSLDALIRDNFEPVNLDEKTLVILGDIEEHSKDLSKLKALTGGDALRGRTMRTQATRPIHLKGLVVLTGNAPIPTIDLSGAMDRRLRSLKFVHVPVNKVNLLSKGRRNQWTGALVDELPGILAYVVTCPDEDVQKYVLDYHKVEALQEGRSETLDAHIPLRQFVRACLEVGKMSHVGFKPRNLKEARDNAERRCIYPAYTDYLSKRAAGKPFGHTKFTLSLVQACESLGLWAENDKDKFGALVWGVRLKDSVFHPDVAAGGPLDPRDEDTELVFTRDHYPTPERVEHRPEPPERLPSLDPGIGQGEESEKGEEVGMAPSISSSTLSDRVSRREGPRLPSDRPLNQLSAPARERLHVTADPQNIHLAIPPDFIDDYVSALTKQSEARSKANELLANMDESLSVEEIMSAYRLFPEPSEAFLSGVRDQVERGVSKLRKSGCFPKEYKQMGISPRILPTEYGKSINSTKKLVRRYGYRLAASAFAKSGYKLVDVDIRSAYTTVLMGLYPTALQRMRRILRDTSLWDSIKEDFRMEGKVEFFDKAAVKVCVYASLFGGGHKAMYSSILEGKRKSSTMTEEEFKRDPMYASTCKLASVTTEFMLRHPIIIDFQDLSKDLERNYRGHWLNGPTGHSYQISEHTFRNLFPCFLQSYEVALIAVPTLRIIEQHPDVEVLGHYHDGNVLAVPASILEEVLESFKREVRELGHKLKLSYDQIVEIQEVFEPLRGPLEMTETD